MDQIDKMLEDELITNSLHEAAHEVRYFGNFGAHPRDDHLDAIAAKDADAVMGVVRSFTVDLYVRPHETKQLTKKRQPTTQP